jgi:hypothetical protein
VVLTSPQSEIDCGGKPLIVRLSSTSVTSTYCNPVMIDGSFTTLIVDNLRPGGTIIGDNNTLLFKSGFANGLRIAGNFNAVRPA